jgi:predicted DNA-binding transcriptional regulator AlpA
MRKKDNPSQHCLQERERHALVARDLVVGASGREAAVKAAVEAEHKRNLAACKPPDPDAYLTLDQITARFSVSRKTIMGHVKDGTLRCIDIGRGRQKRRLRFAPKDIDELIQKRKGGAEQCPSIATPSRRSTGTTSSAKVVAFSVLRNARTSATPKP